jgi:hypothetical protein
MDDTRRFAERMNLVAMEPRGELSSTGYALANPGEEYLILQSDETSEPVTVALEANTYSVLWHNVRSRETKKAGKVRIDNAGDANFEAPFAESGPTVLYLKGIGG